jgi:hypothetical protein
MKTFPSGVIHEMMSGRDGNNPSRGARRYISGFKYNPSSKGDELAKPNYSYEKRQRDLAKKKKQEEKRARKMNKSPAESGEQENQVKEDNGN